MSENLLTCPYNASHQILPHRFMTHLTKCAKSYPEIILQKCIFNATHLLPPEEIKQHQASCPDRISFEKAMNPIDNGYQFDAPERPQINDDDDWEEEVGVQNAYDAAKTRQAGKK